MSELKPCPFCGSAPSIGPANPKEEGDAWTRIRCESSECTVNPEISVYADRGHKRRAFTLWNRRAAPVVTDDVAEDIVEAVGQLVGMSHGGWDMVNSVELCRAFFAEFQKLGADNAN